MLILTASQEKLSSFTVFLRSLTWEKVLPAAITLVVCLILVKVLSAIFNKAINRSKLDVGLRPLVRTAFKALLTIVAILVAAGTLGLDVSALIALLSVVSLAISLAVQDFLANMVGGLVILTAHPFRVGDYVDIGGTGGTVLKIGLTYTDLCTPANQLIHVPNRQVADAKVTNFTSAGTRRMEITVSASYDAPAETVKAALLKACQLDGVLDEPAPEAHLSEYGDSAIGYILRCWATTDRYWEVYFAVLEQVQVTFREAGVTMTYPHLLVHMQKESGKES